MKVVQFQENQFFRLVTKKEIKGWLDDTFYDFANNIDDRFVYIDNNGELLGNDEIYDMLENKQKTKLWKIISQSNYIEYSDDTSHLCFIKGNVPNAGEYGIISKITDVELTIRNCITDLRLKGAIQY